MRKSIQRGSLVVGLAVLGAMMTAGRAEAAGISIRGGVTSGDPDGTYAYTYYLNFYITDATLPTSTVGGTPSASVTASLFGVAASNANALTYTDTSLVPNPPVVPFINLAGSGTGFGTFTVDIYNTGLPITVAGTELLYQYQITTAADYPQTPPTYFSYTVSVGGSTPVDSGNVPLTPGPLGVPEPSSLVLMIMGGTVLPYLAVRERRRRSRRVA